MNRSNERPSAQILSPFCLSHTTESEVIFGLLCLVSHTAVGEVTFAPTVENRPLVPWVRAQTFQSSASEAWNIQYLRDCSLTWRTKGRMGASAEPAWASCRSPGGARPRTNDLSYWGSVIPTQNCRARWFLELFHELCLSTYITFSFAMKTLQASLPTEDVNLREHLPLASKQVSCSCCPWYLPDASSQNNLKKEQKT